MAPSHSRQLLIWTLPIAVIFSYFWYRRRRSTSAPSPTDPGDVVPAVAPPTPEKEKSVAIPTGSMASPQRLYSRSLSGVDSAPIDIVVPSKHKNSKSNSIVISDEDLDLEIEKIKSMRIGNSFATGRRVEAEEEKEKVKKASPVTVPTVVEEKVENKEEGEKGKMKEVPKSTERDSANHSPADVMLASPSLSSISDNRSEGSSDSGKGGSDVVTPPPPLAPDTASYVTLYEFLIPQQLVGRLIGKHGSSVANIREKTGARVIVKKHPTENKMKLCSIEGTNKEIESALKLIRDKFPLKRFPDVTLEQVSFVPVVPTLHLVPEHVYVKLVEGVNNDTVVCHVAAPNHLFLHQPTHPTFQGLETLGAYMNEWYSRQETPELPTPIPANTVCVAQSRGIWYRALILSSDEQEESCYVRFLDYGGFASIENSKLRQIKAEFMCLPFQAAECVLANVKPTDESGWSEEAFREVIEMTKKTIVFTQVVDFTEEGVPLVHCYLVYGPTTVVFLNKELVNRGLAQWIEQEEGAVGVSSA